EAFGDAAERHRDFPAFEQFDRAVIRLRSAWTSMIDGNMIEKRCCRLQPAGESVYFIEHVGDAADGYSHNYLPLLTSVSEISCQRKHCSHTRNVISCFFGTGPFSTAGSISFSLAMRSASTSG